MAATEGGVVARETRAVVGCSHCGLPVSPGLVDSRSVEQFCCHGCRTVFAVIREHGFERYYQLAHDADTPREPARTTARRYEEFDDAKFSELYVRPTTDGLASVELYLEGVHCAACVWLVERVPLAIPGTAEARLDMTRSLARVVWDPRTTPLSAIARFLDALGYPAHPFRGVEIREMRRREDRALLVRIAVAGAIAGNVMTMAFALYGGRLHGIEAEYEALFRWASLAVALPAVLWCAGPFYRAAWGSLRGGTLNMDVPISVGILAGFAQGSWNTVRGAGEVYFDSVTALIFLLLVGRYVQQRTQRAAADSAELLYSLTPAAARLVDEGGAPAHLVPVESLTVGMRVEVRAGESVPVDGVVRQGRSALDTSLLNGESRAAPVAPGDAVHAGTLNLTAPLEIEVRATGERTRVGRLMQMIEEGARRRAPVVRLADRISAVFVAVVLGLAALTLALWWSAGPERALDHAIALLIVTCPCALGLATPLAVAAAVGRAGRAGILIKGGDALERLARPGTILLDKTGTLTSGRSRLVGWWGDLSARPLVLALEAQVEHPVARALVEGLDGVPAAGPVEVARDTKGDGILGRVAGHAVAVGSAEFVERRCGSLPEAVRREVVLQAQRGLTPVVVAVDGTAIAVAAVGDPLRDDARATIDGLRRDGWQVGILSGDHEAAVAVVGRALRLDPTRCRGGVSPEEKLHAVREATRTGPTVMVGDGVNDAAALTAATVGVAVRGGAEAAMAVADVFLAADGLGALRRLLAGARRTMRVIRLNLAFSLAYNVVGAALALAGRIDPLAAAILMPLSSLTVILHSYRARTFDSGDAPCR